MCPLFVGLLTISVMCSMPICVALYFIVAYPSPISLVGLCIASVGKLEMSPSAFLAALFRILSIVSSCFAVKMPWWVAWYLDLISWSITSCFRLGDSSLRVLCYVSYTVFKAFSEIQHGVDVHSKHLV